MKPNKCTCIIPIERKTYDLCDFCSDKVFRRKMPNSIKFFIISTILFVIAQIGMGQWNYLMVVSITMLFLGYGCYVIENKQCQKN